MTIKRHTLAGGTSLFAFLAATLMWCPSVNAQPPHSERVEAPVRETDAPEVPADAKPKPVDAVAAPVADADKQPNQDEADVKAVMLEPGRNLLGERISKTPAGQGGGPSAEVKRVQGMIDETVELLNQRQDLENRMLDLIKKQRAKRTEYDQLPELYRATAGEIITAERKMQGLGGALNLGPQNPQVREYFTLKEQVKGLTAKMRLLEKQKLTLPIEIRNLAPEQRRLSVAQNANVKKIDALIEGWGKILNVSTFLPPRDATAIMQICQQKLIQYPEVVPIRVMLGLCHVHLGQPQAGIEQFEKSLTALGRAGARLQTICMIGISWACLDSGKLDKAAARIADARKLFKRNFELAICEARLAELRQRASTAVTAYRRAMAISPRNPCGYRMAAIMVAKSKVRPPEVALSLANKACELDEFDDFRNSIGLAYAHHAAGDTKARDQAVEKAYSQAGESGRDAVGLMAKDLLKDE